MNCRLLIVFILTILSDNSAEFKRLLSALASNKVAKCGRRWGAAGASGEAHSGALTA